MARKYLVAFDIDGTLRNNTVDQSKAPVANERIRTMLVAFAHLKNVKIMVWSGGGELYARQVAAAFGIDSYVDIYADKQIVSCEKYQCAEWRNTGENDLGHHHFSYDGPTADIAFDDIHTFSLARINLIVREK